MDLRDVRDRILPGIYDRVIMLIGGDPMTETGEEFEAVSELLQGLAICHLFVEGEAEKFRKNLLQSAYARRYFLRKSREQGNTRDRHLALSRGEGFLDAVAAGDLGLARDIARFSATVWEKDWEYEDDFCFFLFLHTVVQQPEPLRVNDLKGILGRFEQALEGGPSTRFPICRALLAKDQAEFADALRTHLEAVQEEIDKKRPSVINSKFLFWPRSYVSVEGLALLKCAEIVGMPIADDFPLCPPEARLDTTPSAYPDLFADLERLPGSHPP